MKFTGMNKAAPCQMPGLSCYHSNKDPGTNLPPPTSTSSEFPFQLPALLSTTPLHFHFLCKHHGAKKRVCVKMLLFSKLLFTNLWCRYSSVMSFSAFPKRLLVANEANMKSPRSILVRFCPAFLPEKHIHISKLFFFLLSYLRVTQKKTPAQTHPKPTASTAWQSPIKASPALLGDPGDEVPGNCLVPARWLSQSKP